MSGRSRAVSVSTFRKDPYRLTPLSVLSLILYTCQPHRLALCVSLYMEINNVRNSLTNPEVLTDHTDVICSTSIERIVTGRNAALTQIGAIVPPD